MRTIPSIFALAAGLVYAGQAFAQDATSPSATSSTSAALPAEIVVTGTHSVTRLQNTPISISTVSAATIAQTGFRSPQDLQYLVPGLSFTPTLGAGFLIRGIGTQGFDYSVDKSVGVVVDDVVQSLPRSIGFNTFGDIDDIEVFKGPQGTLFGRNASAGVIYVTTKKPQLNQYTLDGSVTYGSRNDVKVDDTVNIPVSSNMAARISGVYQRQDGFLDNVYNGTKGGGYHDYAVRAKLLWKPLDNLEIYGIAAAQDHHDGGYGVLGTARSIGAGASLLGFPYAGSLSDEGITPGDTNKKYAHDGDDYVFTKQKDAQLNIKYSLNDYTLTSITAYQHVISGSSLDIDQTQLDYYDLVDAKLKAHQITQEIRLNSPKYKIFDYSLGAFYYKSHVSAYERSGGTLGEDLADNTLVTLSGGRSNYRTRTESYAFFANGNLHLTNKLTVVGGLRYTHDDVHENYFPSADTQYTFIGTENPAAGGANSAHNVSGKVTLQYNPTENVMAYATYSTGYKSPAVSITSGTVNLIKPETVRNFEIGARTQFADRRVTLNVTLFHEKFKNFQAPVAEIVDGVYRAVLSNSPGLLSKGVEADGSVKIGRGLSLSTSLSYVKTKYEGFIVPCYPNEPNISSQGYGCYALGTGTASDVSGLPSVQAPKFTFTVNANYQHDISDRVRGFANVNYYHRSSTYSNPGDPATIIPSYGILNLTAGVANMADSLRLSVFANNALKKFIVTNILPITFAPTGTYINYPSAESARTIGVKLDYAFR